LLTRQFVSDIISELRVNAANIEN